MNNTTQRCTVHTQALFFPVRTPFNFARGVDRVTGNLGHFKLLARLHLYSFVRCHAVHKCVCRNVKHCNLCMAFNLLWLFYIFGWLAKFFFMFIKIIEISIVTFSKRIMVLFFMLYVVCCCCFMVWRRATICVEPFIAQTQTRTHTITAKCIIMCDHLLTSSNEM